MSLAIAPTISFVQRRSGSGPASTQFELCPGTRFQKLVLGSVDGNSSRLETWAQDSRGSKRIFKEKGRDDEFAELA